MPGTNRPARFLHVEDEQMWLVMVEESIRKSGARIELVQVVTLAAACEYLIAARQSERRPDGVLLDLFLPDSRGVDTLEAIQKLTHAPIIICTGSSDHKLILECLDRGVACIMIKGRFDVSTVSEIIIQALQQKLGEISVQRETDRMVGLAEEVREMEMARLSQLEAEFRDSEERMRSAFPDQPTERLPDGRRDNQGAAEAARGGTPPA